MSALLSFLFGFRFPGIDTAKVNKTDLGETY